VHGFGGSDILMTRISILFVIIVVTISPLCDVLNPCSVVGSELLGVDVLEEAAILHGVIVLVYEGAMLAIKSKFRPYKLESTASYMLWNYQS
jgi:hypothetical protein